MGFVYYENHVTLGLLFVYNWLEDCISSRFNGLVDNACVGYINDSLTSLVTYILSLHHTIHSRDVFKYTPNIGICDLGTHHAKRGVLSIEVI